MDNHILLALFHILFVAPLFLSVGFMRASSPDWLFRHIFMLGLVILAYHLYRLFLRINAKSAYMWVNLIHVLLIAPALIYVGYTGKTTGRPMYEVLIMLGFSAGGYHVYNLINALNVQRLQ